MFRYPAETAVVAHLAPLFTFLKWLFIGFSLIALAAGLFFLLTRRHFKT